MMSPTLFADEIENFPIKWDGVKLWKFKDIEENDPDSITKLENYTTQVSFEHVTHFDSTNEVVEII